MSYREVFEEEAIFEENPEEEGSFSKLVVSCRCKPKYSKAEVVNVLDHELHMDSDLAKITVSVDRPDRFLH